MKEAEKIARQIINNEEVAKELDAPTRMWLEQHIIAGIINNKIDKHNGKKRLFEVLDEMNEHDTNNGTSYIAVGSNFISADKVKQGAKISMGAEPHNITNIATGKTLPVLLLIDAEEYKRRMDANTQAGSV